MAAPIADAGASSYVGCAWDKGKPAHLFHGALRDFRLYDRPLSAAEIAQLTAGQVAGPAPAVPGAVTSLVLVDAATNKVIGPIVSPATITLPAGGIAVRAEVSGVTGSVRFGLDGNLSYRVESAAPFSLEGTPAKTTTPGSPPPGCTPSRPRRFVAPAPAGPWAARSRSSSP